MDTDFDLMNVEEAASLLLDMMHSADQFNPPSTSAKKHAVFSPVSSPVTTFEYVEVPTFGKRHQDTSRSPTFSPSPSEASTTRGILADDVSSPDHLSSDDDIGTPPSKRAKLQPTRKQSARQSPKQASKQRQKQSSKQSQKSATKQSPKFRKPVENEEARQRKSDFFRSLKPGMEVTIQQSPSTMKSDVTTRRPDIIGQTGKIKFITGLPSTWLAVQLSSGEVIKIRSSNVKCVNNTPVKSFKPMSQATTERLRKSKFFNSLAVGKTVKITFHPSYRRDQLPARATIVKVPVFPSTWLTVRDEITGSLVKLRTSQIAEA